MINVVQRRCVTCTATSSTPRYLDRCFRCFVYEFPESKLVRNYKTKEAATLAFLRERFAAYDMREDKTVPEGCSKYRPDLIFDFGDRVIIVEVDEHQHRAYETICENRRTMALFVDVNGGDVALGGRPLVVIRFNPDEYQPEGADAKLVPSCWKRTPKTQLLSVRDVGAWHGRLEALQRSIEEHVAAPAETLKEVHEVRLFYDGHGVP